MSATNSRDVKKFQDDDRGFLGWLDDNPDGYFINRARTPKPAHHVLHRSSCSHIDRSPVIRWTRAAKFCSPRRRELEEWALRIGGGEAVLCQDCFG
ncbi:MAG TPA: hypothetical protein VF940_27065 [Streptosporangiaceae bacterium]